MIIRRDGKLVDVPLRLAEAEVEAGIAEAVIDFVGIKETDVTEDQRYGPVRDPANMLIRQTPASDGSVIYRALDPGGVPIAQPRPLYAAARSDARDHAARQAELGFQVHAGKPIPPITDGSEAISEGSGVLGRGPVTTMPGPRLAHARSSE